MIEIEWKLPVRELERNNPRKVLNQYRWIKERLNHYDLTEKSYAKKEA